MPAGELIPVEDLAPRDEYYRRLERGGLLFFPETPFELVEREKDILRGTGQAGGGYHKNIAFRPALDTVSGFEKSAGDDGAGLLAAMRAYSARAAEFAAQLLPRYAAHWHIDFASFRPLEEEGRALPQKKRNDLLHVDAFPTRPTHGDLILRIFTNIHPTKTRVWLTSDPFGSLAPAYAVAAGWAGGSRFEGMRQSAARILRAAGLPVIVRSPYDRFMLRFHDFLKHNEDYQRDCPKYRWEFPPNSTWMVFTDIVPHAVLSGRWALEQTFIVSRGSLMSPQSAPAAILERVAAG